MNDVDQHDIKDFVELGLQHVAPLARHSCLPIQALRVRPQVRCAHIYELHV